MAHFGPFLVVIMFWIFVLGCVITGNVAMYKKRRAAMDVVRAAIERGQQLSPELVDKLTGHGHDHGSASGESLAENLLIGGLVVFAAGIGIAILGGLFSQMGAAAVAMWPILGGAAIVICVGIGLLIAARMVRRDRGGPSAAQTRDV